MLLSMVLKNYKIINSHIISVGADINIKDEDGYHTCPIMPAFLGYPEIVKAFLDIQIDVGIKNGKGQTALHLAADSGHLEIVRELINFKVDLIGLQDDTGFSALTYAICRRHDAVVKELIGAGVALDIQDIEGATVLHIAVIKEHVEYVKVLINAGADININKTIMEGHLSVLLL